MFQAFFGFRSPIRNALLYPAELRGRLGCKDLFEFTLLAVRLEDRLGTGNRGCLCCRAAFSGEADGGTREVQGVWLDRQHRFDFQTAVPRKTGVDDEVVGDLCDAIVMSVPAQDNVFAVGSQLGGLAECLANLAADEEGGPVVVGRFAFVPTRFAERWDVSGDQDLCDLVGQIV